MNSGKYFRGSEYTTDKNLLANKIMLWDRDERRRENAGKIVLPDTVSGGEAGCAAGRVN